MKKLTMILAMVSVALISMSASAEVVTTVWNLNIGAQDITGYQGAAAENPSTGSIWNTYTAHSGPKTLSDAAGDSSAGVTFTVSAATLPNINTSAITQGDSIFISIMKAASNYYDFTCTFANLETAAAYDLVIYTDWYWGSRAVPVQQTAGTGLDGTFFINYGTGTAADDVGPLLEDTNPADVATDNANYARLTGLSPDGSGNLAITVTGGNWPVAGFQLVSVFDPAAPLVDAGSDWVTWSGEPVTVNDAAATNNDPAAGDLTLTWTADPSEGVSIVDGDTETPTITITKAAAEGTATFVTMTLTATQPGKDSVESSMTIEVYDDPCKAGLAAGIVTIEPGDFNADCFMDMEDLAQMAAAWLVDFSLTGPVGKDFKPTKILSLGDMHVADARDIDYPDRVVEAMNKEGGDLVLVCGDLGTDGLRSELELARDILDKLKMPYYPVVGNHDALYSGEQEETLFSEIFNLNKNNYHFVKNGIHFIAIDHGCGKAYLQNSVRPNVIAWINDTLKNIPDSEPIVFFSHYPFGDGVQYQTPNADEVVELFKDKKLLAMVSGHFHGNTERRDNGILMTTTACSSGRRGNHDGTKAKGYRVFYIDNEMNITTEFKEVK